MPDIFWYFVLFLFFVYLIYDSIDENNKKKQAEISRIEYEKKAELQKIEHEKEQLEKERKAIEHEKYLESDEYKQKIYTDEYVLNVKLSFEQYLDKEDYTPDAVSNEDFYIYHKYISKWFLILLSKHRYSDIIAYKIKNDFLNYIKFIRQSGSLLFMSIETKDIPEQSSWERSLINVRAQKTLIEDTFASSIGLEAIDELKKARNLSLWDYLDYAKIHSNRIDKDLFKSR